MSKVKGIGGIFFRAADPDAMNEWYKLHLDVPISEGMGLFKWRDHQEPSSEQMTVWSVFPKDTEYFGNPNQQFMLNYIVESLDECMAMLKKEGVKVDDKIEESEFGRFGWLFDPEGNRIELWEPRKK